MVHGRVGNPNPKGSAEQCNSSQSNYHPITWHKIDYKELNASFLHPVVLGAVEHQQDSAQPFRAFIQHSEILR